MNFYAFFNVQGFGNSYLLGQPDTGEAILIDPGGINTQMIDLIEKNNLYIKYILATHDHDNHVRAIPIFLKIYNDAQVLMATDRSQTHKHTQIKNGDAFEICKYQIKVIGVPGHSEDSVMYKIDNMLFAGDALSCGRPGYAPTQEHCRQLDNYVRDRVNNMDENILVFPGHGPPSLIAAEKRYSIFTKKRSLSVNKQPKSYIDFD